jgi:hypothetical protein
VSVNCFGFWSCMDSRFMSWVIRGDGNMLHLSNSGLVVTIREYSNIDGG